MNKQDKQLNVIFSVLLGLYWMIFAVSSIFIVPLLRLRGFDDSQIGILIAVRSISAVVFAPIIASFLDRHPKIQIKTMLLILLSINVANTFIFRFCELSYAMTFLNFVVLGATTNTMPGLHSALAMKFNNSDNNRNLIYSIGRGVGSVTYAVVSLVLGMCVSSKNYDLSLLLQLGLDIFSILVIFAFPKYIIGKSAIKSDNVKAHGNLYLFVHYPRFTIFLLASAFVFVGYSMLNSFMIDVILDRGGNNSDLGISCFVLGVCELPTALLFTRLKKRFGTLFLLNISAVFATIKMVALYFAPNVYWVWASQTLQMLGNGMYWPTAVHYVNETIAGVDQVKGQALTVMFSVNIGAILGSSVSGKLLCYFNINQVIIFGIICSMVGVVLMFSATVLGKNKCRKLRT